MSTAAPLLRLAVASALLLAAAPAVACSVCAAGDPLVQAGDAASPGREVRLSLETEWLTARMAMEDVGGMAMPAMVEELTQTTVRLGAVVAVHPRVNVVALLPFVRKDVSVQGGGMSETSESFSGLGDAEVGARWFVLDRSNFASMSHHSIALSAGTSLPSGGNDAHDAAGDRVDEHAQLGTGAVGPYAGLLWRLEQSRWHASASVAGRYRAENRFNYRYGPSVAWSLLGQLQLHPRVAAGLAVDGREAAADRDHSDLVANTGGLVLAVAPVVHVGLGGGLWLQLRAQVPVLTRLRGDQDVGPVVSAGVQARVF